MIKLGHEKQTKKGSIMTIETANRLYELRKKQGLSQEELAEKLGVSRQAVSKWERSEASPDTDNLIALAKIYGLSLDELIYGEKATQDNPTDEEQKASPSDEEESQNNDELIINVNEDDTKVKIGPKGILVESNDGDKVKINLKGIFVKSNDGDKVKIDLGGVKIKNSDDDDTCEDDDDDEDFDEDEKEIIRKSNGKARIWLSVPYPIICVIAYLLFGSFDILGGWTLSWIIFITIPLYYSLISAIFKKRLCDFAYPVFTAFAYLYLGLYHSIWHPSWIVFVTIPVYYCIAGAIDKSIKKRAKK